MTDDYDYTSDEEEDVKPNLDDETKNFIEEIKEKEKGIDKKGFSEYFSYKPSTLVSNSNKQDFKKSLDKIKQQKVELNKDERNSANNKNENDRFNMILSVIDRIYQFLSINFSKTNN